MPAVDVFYAVSDYAFIFSSLGMAALVLIGGRRAVNLLLCLFLILWGITVNFLLLLTPQHMETSEVARWANVITNGFGVAILPVYLAFLGAALPTPAARPFGRPIVRALLLLTATGAIALAVAFPNEFDAPVGAGWSEYPAGVRTAVLSLLAAALIGLALAVDALRRSAPGTPARARMRAYTLAFVLFDVGQFAFFAIGSIDAMSGSLENFLLGVTNFVSVVGLGLLARALLRFQLFDFDLKLKRGLSRSALGAAFVAAFFVVSELVQAFASATLGVVAGTLAAGLLLFALTPLQNAADRVADAAMPRVQDTPEYRLVRKREVYLAALQSAAEDGEITDKERSVLATLATQLGLDPREVYELEREARAAA